MIRNDVLERITDPALKAYCQSRMDTEQEIDGVTYPKEAVITAEAPQVVVKEDTLEYNSTAYRTPEGAMLEELVKKLPGAEIDDDGNVKINGKEVKKIMVDGKEFFGGDVKTGLKNLPVNMIDKLKTYDKKSDLARVTGIDDGEEETVLDLKVKKGMNQGWFGNASVAGGTEDRYGSNLMLNRFVDNSQFSLIGSANNVNDQGFSGGGGLSIRNVRAENDICQCVRFPLQPKVCIKVRILIAAFTVRI